MQQIDKKNRLPLYIQLMNILIEMIEEGKFDQQNKLPSERELCETYDVSRITVRQTLQELQKEGYIYKEHGKGTFVTPKKGYDQYLLRVYSFTKEMRKRAKEPSTQIIEFSQIVSNEYIQTALHLNKEEEVYKYARLRSADGEPMIFETSYLPVKRFPDLTREELEKKSLYEVLDEKYGVKATGATEKLYAVIPSSEMVELLKIEPPAASMWVKRYTYLHKEIIEYSETYTRGDRVFYTAELDNENY